MLSLNLIYMAWLDGKFVTDSDIVDFADDHNMSRKDVDDYVGVLNKMDAINHYEPVDRSAAWFRSRVDSIKNMIAYRVDDKETTFCEIYFAPCCSEYKDHITHLPVMKKLISIFEKNGYSNDENGFHWSFCDTVPGTWDLNQDFVSVIPVECAVEYCGAYPIYWDPEDLAEIEYMINIGKIQCHVFVRTKDGTTIPNN